MAALDPLTFKFEPSSEEWLVADPASVILKFLEKVATQGVVVDGPYGSFKVRLGNGEETTAVDRTALPSAW